MYGLLPRGNPHTVTLASIVSRKPSSSASSFNTSASPDMLINIVKAFLAIGLSTPTPDQLSPLASQL